MGSMYARIMREKKQETAALPKIRRCKVCGSRLYYIRYLRAWWCSKCIKRDKGGGSHE